MNPCLFKDENWTEAILKIWINVWTVEKEIMEKLTNFTL